MCKSLTDGEGFTFLGSLRLPEVLVNSIYFERKERATLESGEWLKGGVFTQQGLEFEPG